MVLLKLIQEMRAAYLFNKYKNTYHAQWYGHMSDQCIAHPHDGVSFEDFVNLENNIHPQTKQKMVKSHATGIRRCGVEFVVFPPKSYSILAVALLLWKPELAEELIELFLNEVRTLLSYIENEHVLVRTRTPDRGRVKLQSKNMLSALFVHLFQARLHPHLHLHARLMHCSAYNQKYYSINNESILASQILFGCLLRSAMVRSLRLRGLGVKITNKSHGFFRNSGMPPSIIKLFSSRFDEIEANKAEYAERYPGTDTAYLKMIAIGKNRKVKNESDPKKILQNIINELEQNGFHKEDALRILQPSTPPEIPDDYVEQLLYELYRIHQEQLFTYSKLKILKMLAISSINAGLGSTIAELQKPLKGEDYVNNIQKIITTIQDQIKKEDDARNRITYNYAENAIKWTRRARKSAAGTNHNLEQDHRFTDNATAWWVFERVYDLSDRKGRSTGKACGFDTQSQALLVEKNRPVFSDLFGSEKDSVSIKIKQ